MTIRILHLFSSFNLGGKEARAVRLMNAFGDRAWHMIVSGVPDALNAREAIAPGIRHEIAQDPPPLTGKPSTKRYEAIARLMQRFDLVLSYNWGAIDGAMARRVFTKGMPPLIHHEDGFNEDEANGLKPVRNMYRRVALGAAHALVVPSHQLEQIALKAWKQPRERIHRISNGIALDGFDAKPKPSAIPGFKRRKGEPVIGTVAGLRAVKDIPMLVRAAGGMQRDTQLVVVGEGPERQKVLDTAELMAMEDRLVMPGFLSDPQNYMGLFDIFALSSKSEQQPIAVMEAMAAGLPIVAPPVGDVLHMVSEANRPYISPDWNEVHLRDRLQVLADNPDGCKVIGKANREKALTEFGEDAMIAAYARLYGEALGKPDALICA
ncbi:glycosyltransferase family 4 protein [Stakelama sediminis]|uniref:Glycosyltransferase involved in cell wall biosynthesis n=1 Tax=Stakelama sediminis TaxID=463200 RepID=A0A840YYR4_9SPHN|nr:glycosyltransferase family 4 protein [Stakelama sediminis]MBB5718670.1 glycosyltransferase involved in cell wall biosynthesis [Stakelama sediminis]